jgi:hypothetical protein
LYETGPFAGSADFAADVVACAVVASSRGAPGTMFGSCVGETGAAGVDAGAADTAGCVVGAVGCAGAADATFVAGEVVVEGGVEATVAGAVVFGGLGEGFDGVVPAATFAADADALFGGSGAGAGKEAAAAWAATCVGWSATGL